MRIEVPDILQESVDRFIGEEGVETSHLFLDISLLVSKYGDEDEDAQLVFRKDVELKDTVPAAKVRLWFNGITAAISFESETLSRYLLIDHLPRLVETRMPEYPTDIVDDVVDKPNSHGATRLEINDFQRLLDLVRNQVMQECQPKRTISSIVDRHLEQALERALE